MTPFDPCLHSWRFANHFTVGPVVYGLCGGMCYAALDYWRAGVPIPTDRQPTPALWRYLMRRQLDSMRGPTLATLWRMMRLDETYRLDWARNAYLTAGAMLEIDNIPVPLVLVRGHGLRDVTQNHQVLAVDFDDERLLVYDPNHPGETCCLSWPGEVLLHSHDGTQRGMFVQDYEARGI